MMITFITSIRHPFNSNNYKECWNLLNKSLNSICNQTYKNIKVIVVANEILDKKWKNVDYIKVTLPPPIDKNHAHIHREFIQLDKGCKYLIGLKHAQKYNSDYNMFFDADDYIHRELAQRVISASPEYGLDFKAGYIKMQNFYKEENNFSNICGTCHAIKTSLWNEYFDLGNVGGELVHSDFLKNNKKEYITELLGRHQPLSKTLSADNKSLNINRERLVMYHKGTGENWAKTRHIHDSFDEKDIVDSSWFMISDGMKLDFNI